MPFLSPLFTLRRMLCVTKCLQGYLPKHAFWCSFVWIYSSMHKKAEESSIQYSCRVDVAVCVRALQMCVCVCASDVCVCVCACASDVCACAHALQMCVSVCARFRCVCARASDVCVCASDVCVRMLQMCARKSSPSRATVTPTIPSILNAHLVRSGSPYIESWYVRLNENARIGGNA